ncbi:MAG: hypothetical protein AMXMBFR13_23410 [Phycisphaerae bacterium]
MTGALMAAAGCSRVPGGSDLRVTWEDEMLTLHSDRLPGGRVETWYLEAFCRRGSTDREWEQTTIPFTMEKIAADPEGCWVKLRTLVDGKVEILHDIQAAGDEVDLRMELVNRSDEHVDVDWAQPCTRVGTFTGRGQDDYFEKCFIFTQRGLTRMHETHREQKARYTPGQVYVPEGIDLNDVNPRPISRTKPVNGLVGCFSADERLVLAMAWSDTQELFQGIIKCIHSDFRIGGMKPGERKMIHGKIYLLANDPAELLRRYQRDFPASAGARAQP